MTTQTYRASAFLGAARSLGVAVTVGSERAQALASFHPAGHLTLDFGVPAAAAQSIREFARASPLDAVVAADDDGVIVAAEASRALGLPFHSTEGVRAARDKFLMREGMARHGIPTPRFERVPARSDPDPIARRVEYPCVLKPTSLSGSRGVIRADDPAAFVRAFRRIARILADAGSGAPARECSILVESYVPGDEIALEGIVTGRRLQVLAVFDKPDPLVGPFFEETIYVTPSRHPSPVLDAARETVARTVVALGLDHGPIHAEVRVEGGRAWLVEIAPRAIGGLCSRALRFDDGSSLETVLLRHALGESVEAVERERRAAGVMMIPIPCAGTLRGVRGREAALAIEDIEEVVLTIPVGDRLVPPPEGSRYLGFAFARAERAESVERALRASHAQLEFEVESETSPDSAGEVPEASSHAGNEGVGPAR